MKSLTRKWIKKAEDDFKTARQIAASKPPMHGVVCFHCQQAVEKYLKALLNELGHSIPKIHDIGALTDLLKPHVPFVKAQRFGLAALTQFTVEYRYPGHVASSRQAGSSLKKATKLRESVNKHLKINQD